MQDLLSEINNDDFIRCFYESLSNVSILDPTCGSGAFLFAALNILEPLYEICIDKLPNVREEIKDKYRSNIQYFIYKNIILRNLYGVDIMAEATEIAKLRLFLKMVAVVEADKRLPNLGLDPLPDIDFNIKCGNTLIGYANEKELEEDLMYGDMLKSAYMKEDIDNRLKKVSKAFSQFKHIQIDTDSNIDSIKKSKEELREELAKLNDLLNHKTYGTRDDMNYEEYIKTTQPFHWIAEYYEIIHDHGGFDVIIGNPPYLEQRQISYKVKGFKTENSSAVHAYCIERADKLLNKKGSMSMIVPLALVCTQRMIPVQKILESNRSSWYSSFSWRPAKLFDTVNRALSIFIINNYQQKHIFSTKYIKWTSDIRSDLFQKLSYIDYDETRNSFWVPKLNCKIEQSILQKLLSIDSECFANIISSTKNEYVYYRTTGGLYWKVFTNFSPKFFLNEKEGKSSRETHFVVRSNDESFRMVAILSSNLFWFWYTITSNLRDLNPSDISGFKIAKTLISDDELLNLGKKYISDLNKNSTMLTRVQKGKGETKTQSFKISLSKPIIDKIDTLLAKHYGFTEEELDYIINYDIKYRMGNELETDENEVN